jgi:DNA-directed RNA polymerase subunit RPC12/RpoP
LPGALISFCCLLALVVPSRQSAPNARCPACGKEFHISEDYRGNLGAVTREIPCPRCGLRFPPVLLYKPEEGK